MWQFAEACRGLKDACVELGIPVTGGNVSLYNQTGETAILPTPVVAVLGVIDDVTRRTPDRLPGDRPPGAAARRDPRGAVRLGVGPRGARPPRRPRRRGSTSPPSGRSASCSSTATGVLSSAHDLSDGGLAQALVESCLRHGVGVRVELDDVAGDPFVALFSESAGRVLVTVAPEDEERLFELAAEHGVPITSLGRDPR